MPFTFGDPFPNKLTIKPTDKQLADMIEKGMESYDIFTQDSKTTLQIADTFWNRRKLKKLKIDFKRSKKTK